MSNSADFQAMFRNIFEEIFGSARSSSPSAPTPAPKGNTQSPQAGAPAHRSASHRPVFGTDHLGLVGTHDRGFVISRLADVFAPWHIARITTMDTRVGGTGTDLASGLSQAVRMLCAAPQGMLRRIWLLSDGMPVPDTRLERERIVATAREAAQARINVNTIGFGEPGNWDPRLLGNIAAATHRGRYVEVSTARKLAETLAHGHTTRTARHRAEATVFVIDCSLSMNEPMEGQRKIDIVKDTLLKLLYYKQQMFA